jgi:CRISPR-associated protein Csm4
MADAVYAVVLEPRRVMEPPPSDRLFGALAWATVWLYPQDRWFIEKPERFVLSSAFPLIDGVRYWPKPLVPPTSLDPSLKVKELKKVRYVSEDIWTEWMHRPSQADVWPQRIRENQWRIHAGGLALATRAEVRADAGDRTVLCTEEPVPHARIDRLTMATVPSGALYFENATFVAPAVKFWFAVRMNPDDIPVFRALLRFLEDRGIGGNRSVGMNQFRLHSIEPLDRPWWSLRSRRWVNLSVYIPDPGELDWDSSNMFYEALPSRPRAESEGPWAARPLKRAFLYWAEGSIAVARRAKLFYGRTLTMRTLPDGSRLLHSGLALPAFLPET